MSAMSVSASQHSPVTYANCNYMIDGTDRSLSYSPAGTDMMAPFPTPATPDVNSGFPTQASGQQLTPTMPSPAFTQYPGTPTSFIATSPHEVEHHHHHQQMMHQNGTVDMYSIQPHQGGPKDS
jgi:hypothetical protein